MTDEERRVGESREPTLDDRLNRLNEIVTALERDDLELDRALRLFEEGVAHVREAERVLEATQLRIEELIGEGADTEARVTESDEG